MACCRPSKRCRRRSARPRSPTTARSAPQWLLPATTARSRSRRRARAGTIRWPRSTASPSPHGSTATASPRRRCAGTSTTAAVTTTAPAPALAEAARIVRHAPWLVANLQLDAPLDDRPGASPSWDNVIYASSGLGYVDAMHQSTRPFAAATVLTAYVALGAGGDAALV